MISQRHRPGPRRSDRERASAAVLVFLAALLMLGALMTSAQTLTDDRSVQFTHVGSPSTTGPVSLLGLDIPLAFEVELSYEIAHSVALNVAGPTGSSQWVLSGAGGAIDYSERLVLEAGRTYEITETYTIVASLDSFALSGEFPYSAEVGWEFVAPNDGEYTYTAAAAIRDVLVTVQGDVVGVSEGVVLADTYYIGLETTREIPGADSLSTRAPSMRSCTESPRCSMSARARERPYR